MRRPIARRGGETLYAVFKTTCPTCELTWPFLERIRQIAEGGDLRVVAVSQDDAAKTTGLRRAARRGSRPLYDPEPWPASDALGVTNVPTLFRVGADGTIAETVVGFDRGAHAGARRPGGRRSPASPPPTLFRARRPGPPIQTGLKLPQRRQVAGESWGQALIRP